MQHASKNTETATPEGAAAREPDDIASLIAPELPYLRRYARALTGSQGTGDRYASASLEAILADPASFDHELKPRVALFQVLHKVWTTTGAPHEAPDPGSLEGRAHRHMAGLTTNTREALLLRTIEEFQYVDIARIMQISQREAEELVNIALREMQGSVRGKVMVIEDEAVTAMDIETIVSNMGHAVTGIARTHAQAVKLARAQRPNLILADIQLADDSSGIEAVNEILKFTEEAPVIFITAFPERLLTGERPEPAFLISKPYSEEKLRSSVSQAMFFASTETLNS
ncbi:MAG: response regulator [Pararhodobacter sp.]|nr:response regulator [Pararhodobacter sp.]